jgi:hypothetical protein
LGSGTGVLDESEVGTVSHRRSIQQKHSGFGHVIHL